MGCEENYTEREGNIRKESKGKYLKGKAIMKNGKEKSDKQTKNDKDWNEEWQEKINRRKGKRKEKSNKEGKTK